MFFVSKFLIQLRILAYLALYKIGWLVFLIDYIRIGVFGFV